jgi:hypothetical protein
MWLKIQVPSFLDPKTHFLKTYFHFKTPNKHPENLNESISTLKTSLNHSKNIKSNQIKKLFHNLYMFFWEMKV